MFVQLKCFNVTGFQHRDCRGSVETSSGVCDFYLHFMIDECISFRGFYVKHGNKALVSTLSQLSPVVYDSRFSHNDTNSLHTDMYPVKTQDYSETLSQNYEFKVRTLSLQISSSVVL